MSGNGDYSGGGGGGTAPGGGSSPDCTSLSIKTQLASPKSVVISKLNVGDVLEVDLIPPTGPVQLSTAAGEVAGAVLPPDLDRLIQCITDGHSYKARVLSITGGNCQVLITHE